MSTNTNIMSYNVNLHSRNAIPETAVNFRDPLTEASKLTEVRPGGIKYIWGQFAEKRFEKYYFHVWSRMATNHPVVGVIIQGNRNANVALIDGWNVIGKIQIAIPSLRFAQANQLNDIGEDKLAGTFIDEFTGKSLVADTTRQEIIKKYGVDSDGDITSIEDDTTGFGTRATALNDVMMKYGASRKYATIANGSTHAFPYPILEEDADRGVAVWNDGTKAFPAAGFPNYTGDTMGFEKSPVFEGITQSSKLQSGKFVSLETDNFPNVLQWRTIKSAEQIVGIMMNHVPVQRRFENILHEAQDFIKNPREYVDRVTWPTAILALPYFTGNFSSEGNQLLSAGDVLPGGIFHEECMIKRCYTFLGLGHTGNKKLPSLNSPVHVGARAEISIGGTLYVPVHTSGKEDTYTIKTDAAGLIITPTHGSKIILACADGFDPDKLDGVKILITNRKTGACQVLEATVKVGIDSIVTTGPTDIVYTPEDTFTVALVENDRVDVGSVETFETGVQNLESAMGETAINRIQGVNDAINTFVDFLYDAYVRVGRVLTNYVFNASGDYLEVNFAPGSQGSRAKTFSADGTLIKEFKYTKEHLKRDIVSRGFTGKATVRIDVFSALKVSKVF